jgi:hypothetical protein
MVDTQSYEGGTPTATLQMMHGNILKNYTTSVVQFVLISEYKTII